jgi:RNA polymerase sigma-70 factor (ECF subfamily)
MTILLLLGPPPTNESGGPARPRRTLRLGDDSIPVEKNVPIVTDDERDLLDRLRADDERALGALHAKYWTILLRYAMHATGRIDLAEDVVQDMFIDLWRRRSSLVIQGSLRVYLFGGVRRRSQHVMRTERRAQHREAVVSLHVEARQVGESGADAAVRMAELEAVVRQTVAALPERCRDVFFLYQENELSVAEIAETLGIAEATVRVQVHRAMSAIWQAVESYLGN